ncbi:MAG: hypothetical protein JHC85_13255 [Chthoniobacterales bacterium]|nr:hypothetical protein [Chthoniobacterales bacterium]
MSEDPFKEKARRYDRAICARGGVSVFGIPYPRPLDELVDELLRSGPAPGRVSKSEPMTAAEYRDWREGRKRRSESIAERNRGHKAGRGSQSPKPGRIVAGLTGKLGGFMGDM